MYAAPLDAGFTRAVCTSLFGIQSSLLFRYKLFRYAEAAVEGIGHAPEHRLNLLVGSDPLQALLASKSTLFESAKGRCGGELFISIDPNHSCFQRPRHTPCAFVIRGPDP